MLKKIIQIILGLGFAILFLHLLREQVQGHEKDILLVMKDGFQLWPFYALMMLCYIMTLIVRAHRMTILCDAPGEFWLSFRSIAISYLVQLPASKLGEVVRIAVLKRYSKLSVGRIMAAVFIDRILDVLALLFLLVISFYQGGATLMAKLFPGKFEQLQFKIIAIIIFGLLVLIFFIFWGKALSNWIKSSTWLPDRVVFHCGNFLDKFSSGMENIHTPARIAYMLGSTILIWVGYFFITYFAIAFFPQLNGHAWDMREYFLLFICGTIGMLVPVPGAISYIFFMALGMEAIFKLSPQISMGIVCMTFIVSIWLTNLLLGFASIIAQVLINKKLKMVKMA